MRHYDRIDLLKPAKVDPSSGYRYYSDIELIYLDVINFCKKKEYATS
ncbi:MerR family transcriptional regulator [Paenibacillus sp. FSL K6-3166]|nr:MerR family transcriptional regulator [Paenibacillus sp. VTT E-133291]